MHPALSDRGKTRIQLLGPPSPGNIHPNQLLLPFIFPTQPGNFALPVTVPSVRGYFKSYPEEKTLGTPHPSLFSTKGLNSCWIAQVPHSTPGANRRPTPWGALSSPELTLGYSLDQKPKKLAEEQGLILRRRQRRKNSETRYNKCSLLATSIVLFFLNGRDVYWLYYVSSALWVQETQPRSGKPRRRRYINTLRNPTEIQEQEPLHSWALWKLEIRKEQKLSPQGLSLSWFLGLSAHRMFPLDYRAPSAYYQCLFLFNFTLPMTFVSFILTVPELPDPLS